jgi:hypothetical protein
MYLDADARQRVYRTLEDHGSRAPLAFVRTAPTDEPVPTYQQLELQLWPGGERQVVAHADYHGAWLDWLA